MPGSSSAKTTARSPLSQLPRRRLARAEEAVPSVDLAVGVRIRGLRKQRGLSLEAVAASTGLSIGFLSQIERGLSSPTLRALTSLADVTGVGIADLLQAPPATPDPAPRITRSDRRADVAMWKSGITKALLAGGVAAPHARFAFTVLDFEAGASSGAEHYRHRGEEAGYVVEGRLLLAFDSGPAWTLEPGDSFHFGSERPHRFENASRRRTVVVMLNLSAGAG